MNKLQKTQTFFVYFFTLICFTSSSCSREEIKQSKKDNLSFKSINLIDRLLTKKGQDSIVLFMPTIENDRNFLSLSSLLKAEDISNLSQVVESLRSNTEDTTFIDLDKECKNLMLSKANIARTDSVYIYYYELNLLKVLPLKDFVAVAVVDDNIVLNNNKSSKRNYKFGFSFSPIYEDNGWEQSIVFIGLKNPFALVQLTAIDWKEVSPKTIPNKILKKNNYSSKAYYYENNKFRYYLIDYYLFSERYEPNIRTIMVVDLKTNSVLINENFTSSKESPLTTVNKNGFKKNQWTGKLLKNKDDVIWGVNSYISETSEIVIINKNQEKITLN